MVEDPIADGWRVGVLARGIDRHAAVAERLGDAAIVIECDVADEDQIAAAIATSCICFHIPSAHHNPDPVRIDRSKLREETRFSARHV